MEKDEIKVFSWTGLFLVTSVCFFVFSNFIKFLEGYPPRIFIWIGFIALFLGLVSGAADFAKHSHNKKKSNTAS
jgi:hypothetical protein